MKNKIKITATLALLCYCLSGFSQDLSNKGKDFWVGYGHHQFMETGTNTQEMVLYFSAEQAANVTVTINGTAWLKNYVVPANSVIVSDLIPKAGTVDARLYSLPCSFVPPGTPCGGEGIFTTHGIHIVSDVPIVAYAHIYGSASSGATMLMPVETWGYSYITLNSKQDYGANCFSWAYTIAQQNNTVIEVTPAATTRFGRPANVPYTITLNRGEIYQFMAGPETGSAKPELSGTKIRSIANAAGECYPIAVFAGSSRTRNPQACGSDGGDNDNQQCFPSQAWGKRYLTAPTSNSNTPSTPATNTFKIAVKDPTTVVTRNGVQIPLGSLINNTYYTYASSTADYITADKPIMMAQYMTGGSGCMGGTSVGDPEMMYISPLEQGIKRIGFYRNTNENITVNYLTLVIPTAGVSSLLIDGSATFSYTYPHPNLAGYTVVIKRWSAAQAQAIAQSDSAFTAITYGMGSVESYGYNAGTKINNLNAVGSIFNVSDTSTTTTSHAFTCNNTPVKLSVLLAYPTPPTKLVWKLSLVGGGLSPNIDVTDNAPTPVGPVVMINGLPFYKYTIPGNYTFTTTGTYTVPIMATHPSIDNCNNTEKVSYEILVNVKPVAGFTFTHSGCITDAVQFNGPASSNNGYTLNQWLWTFPGATTDNTQNPTHTFTVTGNQNVTLHVVTTEGCVSDSIRSIPVFAKPTASISTVPGNATVCEGGSVSFTGNVVFGGSGPISSYYWDFGNSTTNNTVGPHSATYPTYGTYNAYFIAGVSGTCKSDTAFKTVRVFAKPTTSFSYPAGCLPAGGSVQFTSTANTPDGQAITGHSWNFGDPGSGANNTSTAANPVHNYSTFGNYTITYSVTTANGCTKDTTVNATFNLPPTFNYPALASVCYSVPSVSVATASVTNGVTGSGVYHGPGTTLAGIFTPSVAGAGTHTIWYVFSTTAGCNDSVSRTITVYPRVGANFVIPGATCLPVSGNVQFNYSGTLAAGQTYAWNFGDPGSGANNTSTLQNPTHNYTTGPYTITLTVTDGNACVDDSVMTINFTVKPALAYPALAAVCENVAGTVSVATASVTNGVPGAGVYHGPSTDLTGNFNPSLAGPGTHTIWYVYTATGNCVDSISRTITVYAKPAASFTYPSAACLPASGLAQFNYNGSMSAGQTYAWNFGDPGSGANNTSTLQNPTHNYSNTGVHTISVTVTNTNGCVDDSIITATFSVKPALAFPAMTAVCESDTDPFQLTIATVTNGVMGTGVYHGPGVINGSGFFPPLAGPGTHTIWYVFTSSGNCIDSISQTITVKPKPLASFTLPAAACLPTTGLVQFTYNGSVGAGQTYLWEFGDPGSGAANTSTLASPTHNYSNTGSHDIVLIVTGGNGCVDDTVLVRTFSVTPALSFASLGPVCENVTGTVSVATATVTNGVTGTGVYSGPGTNAAGDFNPFVAGAGTHTITYTFTSSGSCVGTITQTITVKPKPLSSFTVPAAACLPTTGLVQFTYNGSVAVGQTYLWDFGDPASGAANSSTQASPSHNYSNTGSHDIILTVTGTNGCTDDTVLVRTFSVTPALTYPALNPVCESVAGTVSVATATVSNAVSGTGVYSGPGTNAAGDFNPSVAGAGTHTITYTFTSTGNCIATITKTITVYPKPAAAFNATADICLNQQASFTNITAAAPGNITSWEWYFGDATTDTRNNNASFSKSYAAFGNYTVKLVTLSSNGCHSDTAYHTVAVHSVPKPDFTMPASVCMPGTTSFTNASVSPDGSTLSYNWDFGDASGTSNQTNPGYDYATASSYNIKLLATSSFGCFEDTIKTFSAFFDKPVAAFNVNPNAVCQGNPNSFDDNSTAPNSTIASHQWTFGDGTTSTETDPVKVYNAPGVYTVQLVVTSTEQCVSDPLPKIVTVYLQPTVDAGQSFVVQQGTTIKFHPAVNDPLHLAFLWSPAAGLSSATALEPSLQAMQDETYTLTATGDGNCVASDFLTVKIYKPIKIPNAISPNGDQINDVWVITNIEDYANASVEVFNRYGQKVYSATNYSNNWGGTYNGKPLPVATYYYIIDLKRPELKPFSGSITIIR